MVAGAVALLWAVGTRRGDGHCLRGGQVSTHIRMAGEADYGVGTYCGALPVETISLFHYQQGQHDMAAQRGHVERLPAPICDECVAWVTHPLAPCQCGCGRVVPGGMDEFAHPEDFRDERG